jgi:hypothetical protein
MMERLSL